MFFPINNQYIITHNDLLLQFGIKLMQISDNIQLDHQKKATKYI